MNPVQRTVTGIIASIRHLSSDYLHFAARHRIGAGGFLHEITLSCYLFSPHDVDEADHDRAGGGRRLFGGYFRRIFPRALSDRFGRRVIMLAALFGWAGVFIGFSLTKPPVVFLILSMINGLPKRGGNDLLHGRVYGR